MANNQINSLRQVTVEVMEGSPVVLPINPPQDVDTTLLNKLFPDLHKRKGAAPKPARVLPSKRIWAPTMTISEDDSGPSPKYPGASNPPKKSGLSRPKQMEPAADRVEVGRESNLRDALNLLQDYNTDKSDDTLKKLQCEALKVQMEKDRVMSQYYAKKLQLLNNPN